jgi:hypothetical protein
VQVAWGTAASTASATSASTAGVSALSASPKVATAAGGVQSRCDVGVPFAVAGKCPKAVPSSVRRQK